MSAALEVRDLRFRHAGGFALERPSFTAGAGRFTVLLGPNGAGKSTLVNLLTGLYAPEGGTIHIDGHDLALRPCRALARLGVVFQSSTLDLDLTAERNLLYGAALYGLWGAPARRAAEEGLRRFGLEEARHRPARALSGGHRRRLEMARALIHRPALLVCDEATVGLDLPSRRALVAHLRALCRDEGAAVLWATHLLDEVESDDPVVVLARGRICGRSTAAELMRDCAAATLEEAFGRLIGDGDRI